MVFSGGPFMSGPFLTAPGELEKARTDSYVLPSRRDLPPLPPVGARYDVGGFQADAFSFSDGFLGNVVTTETGQIITTQGGRPIEVELLPSPSSGLSNAVPGNSVPGALIPGTFVPGTIDVPGADLDHGRRAPTSAVGRAIATNQGTIVLQTASLVELLSSKIAELEIEHDRLNSEDGRAGVLSQIEQYKDIRARVVTLSAATSEYIAGHASEAAAVETTTTFVKGVKNWWHAQHVTICDRAFDRATFFSALALCDLVGAGGVLSVTAATALVAGKPFADALGSAVKLLKEK
jgi:hypothetical protein